MKPLIVSPKPPSKFLLMRVHRTVLAQREAAKNPQPTGIDILLGAVGATRTPGGEGSGTLQ